MNVLVTGASGFLGGHLVKGLCEKGYNVIGMVRDASNTDLVESIASELRYGDLTRPDTLEEAMKGVEVVFHLAAYYTFHGKKDLYHKVNVEGTRSMLEAALKNRVKRLIYCSTTEVIGAVKNPPADEDTPLNPQYEYGRSKLKAEELVRQYGEKGLSFTIIRLSGIYGPRNIDDVSYWTITSFAKNSLGTRFTVGSGENLIQFVHVEDVVKAFTLALEKEDASKNQIYIISDDKAYTYSEVYNILAELTGRKPPKRHIPKILAKILIAPIQLLNSLSGKENFLYHTSTIDAVTSDRYYSVEKAKKDLGFKPAYDLKTGLRKTIE